MTSLVKWQFFSMLSRFAAMAIGIAQSIFIVRILSTADFGLVGLVTSVGSVVGIILHLGLVSGATREIAAAESREEQFKIFVTAFLVRFGVALLLSLGLFVASPLIARRIYSHPEISIALKIFAVALLVQSVQGIFNAVLAGLRKFKQVFIYQTAIALVSFSLYVPLVYKFGFYGYFYALLALAVVSSTVLLVLAMRCFGCEPGSQPRKNPSGLSVLTRRVGELAGFNNLSKYAAKLFSVGLAIYLVKIIFTLWQKFGPLVLGKTATAAELGIFNFGLFYATKLMTASDAVTAVNLPVFSESFADGLERFKQEFRNNFEKLYVFITFAAVSAIFWSPEFFRIVAGDKYLAAVPLVPWLILAFWCYSFVNIIKSSIMIPAKMNRDMIISYLLLLLGTVGGFYILGSFGNELFRHSEFLPCTEWYCGISESDGKVLANIALAMSFGGLLALLWQSRAVARRLELRIFTRKEIFLAVFLFPLALVHNLSLDLFSKTVSFAAVSLFIALLVDRFGILDWKAIWTRVLIRARQPLE